MGVAVDVDVTVGKRVGVCVGVVVGVGVPVCVAVAVGNGVNVGIGVHVGGDVGYLSPRLGRGKRHRLGALWAGDSQDPRILGRVGEKNHGVEERGGDDQYDDHQDQNGDSPIADSVKHRLASRILQSLAGPSPGGPFPGFVQRPVTVLNVTSSPNTNESTPP